MPESPWRLEEKREDELTGAARTSLQALLANCFPDYLSTRLYYKQLPHWRLLAWRGGELVGQLGVDHRVVRVADQMVPIYGVIDLAVTPQMRGQGLGTLLLRTLKKAARGRSIDYIVLFADDPRLYERRGFKRARADVTFLAIDEGKSYGSRTRDLGNCMMVCALGGRRWPRGAVDMLGYLF